MIVWLASYPRSGNTLLRTVFKQTMGLGSYSDEIMMSSVGHTDLTKQSYGNLIYDGSWDSFYQRACSSKDTFLVKTHLPPHDNQPVIYVVRDGRAATESYVAYHSSFIQDSQSSSSIMELMLGDDYYGDWSTHYHMWNSRAQGCLLEVRFEELVSPDNNLLEKLRDFVGFNGEIKSFENPMNELHLQNPNFFRSGHTDWHGGDQWTEKLKFFFIALHGDLLIQLGYINIMERDTALSKLDPMEVRLIELANRGFIERNVMRYEAHSKEKVIQQLALEKQASIAKNGFGQSCLTRIFGLSRKN